MKSLVVTQPEQEPLTTAEVKRFLRVEDSLEDALIKAWIIEARKYVEDTTDRALLTQTKEFYSDCFEYDKDNIISLPANPIQSVTWIKYLDDSGVEITLASSDYRVDTVSEPARIEPAYGLSWPSTYPVINAVKIRVACGFADVSDVPEGIKTAMMLYIATLYENRGDFGSMADPQKLPDFKAVDRCLMPFRVWRAA